VDRDVTRALEDRLGAGVVDARPVSGGDVAASYRVDLADGRVVFAKTLRSAPHGAFTTEATGLAWLREAGTVAVPEVLGVADEPPLLALEWIEEGRSGVDRGAEARFGRELAALHRAGAPCFGREDRRSTGSRGLPNDPAGTWAEFYAERRLLPLAAIAEREGALPSRSISDLRSVAGRLDELVGPPEPPARLHGDLWAGNRLVDRHGTSWLVDPAAFGGHREFDLAMMRLFGGFGRECHEAYADAAPLADGWEDRVALHQLAPLVVHAIKFGGGYVASVADALAQYR
jgi:fructosamine-3-kinase